MKNDKGTYVIILYVGNGKSIQIGKLGKFKFRKGYYAYVGSAFGPGGLKSRLKHHIEPKKTYHWHIDFLNPLVTELWVSNNGARLEHEWARALGKTASDKILGFGCSDCTCESHLFFFKSMMLLKNSQKELCEENNFKITDSQLLSDLTLEAMQLPDVFKLIEKDPRTS